MASERFAKSRTSFPQLLVLMQNPVLHILDLPFVGHNEDQVVPEFAQSPVGPLVLENLLDKRREPLGVGIDGERVVMKQDQVGSTIPHCIVDLVGTGREGLKTE